MRHIFLFTFFILLAAYNCSEVSGYYGSITEHRYAGNPIANLEARVFTENFSPQAAAHDEETTSSSPAMEPLKMMAPPKTPQMEPQLLFVYE